MKLPEEFINRMNLILADSFPDFLASFDEKQEKAVQLHPQQTPEERILANMPSLRAIEHLPHAYYCENDKIGQHPYHHAGILYSQDPAAMLPAGLYPFQPGDKVLDLCAAPGGKTSQIAASLEKGTGYLVANEINPARNRILISNLERMGYNNVLVTRLSSEELAKTYDSFFDVVLVDAPCSGEGMFRKYPESVQEWSVDSARVCSQRQREILAGAVRCLKPGGSLLYSTCTYAVEENEAIIDYCMKELHLQPCKCEIASSHLPEYLFLSSEAESEKARLCQEVFSFHPHSCDFFADCHRFYPHKWKGEGQFFCHLKKEGNKIASDNDYLMQIKKAGFRKISRKNLELLKDTLNGQLTAYYDHLYEYKDKIYILPKLPVPLPDYGITRLGIPAGELVKNRFQPHHSMLRAYGSAFDNRLDLSLQDIRIWQYLNGQELTAASVPDGYGVICVDGTSLGGFKASKGRLKNHYPKALRNLNLSYPYL